MSHQINLFNPSFSSQKRHFSSSAILRGLALVLLGATATVWYGNVQLAGLRASLESGDAQLKVVQRQLAEVTAAAAARIPDPKLEQEVAALEAELQARNRALDTLQRGDFGSATGYAQYLQAFARQAIPGLWLTGFEISASDMQLRGRALRPELVPAYIARLKQEKAMHGKSFAALDMVVPQVESGNTSSGGKDKAAAPYVEFALRSALETHDQTGQRSNGLPRAPQEVKALSGVLPGAAR